jgi:hypothetical protein
MSSSPETECTGIWQWPTTHVDVPSESYRGETYDEVRTQTCSGCDSVLVTCNGSGYVVTHASGFGNLVAAFGVSNMEAINYKFNPWMQ